MLAYQFVSVVILKSSDVDVGDELPRSVNIEALVESPNSSPVELKTKTISVDVILVAGTTTTIISQNQAIFYDAELLAIVHRSKSRTTNLVSTVVWAWRGKRCTLGEKEDRKLQELAKRYGTSAVRFSISISEKSLFNTFLRTSCNNIPSPHSWYTCSEAN